jgi:hypothetical protein
LKELQVLAEHKTTEQIKIIGAVNKSRINLLNEIKNKASLNSIKESKLDNKFDDNNNDNKFDDTNYLFE